MATVEIPREQLEIALRVIAEATGEKAPPKPSKTCEGCARKSGPLGCTLVSLLCKNSPDKPYYLTPEKALERQRRL